MDGSNFNTADRRPRVLVAPLDWGLGHATRCIPIIFKLLQENCDVIIAAEGGGKTILQREFPALHFIHLQGYRVSYSAKRSMLPVKLLLQFPKIISRVYAEKRWLKKIVEELRIDAVISDNRMGLHHALIPCIYITHQLRILTGNSFTERIAQRIHYHFINRFTACWVPDVAGEKNLAGLLAHPSILPKVPVKYIGPLSRFKKNHAQFKYDACIILSGPEPQRTIFEKKVVQGLQQTKAQVFLVRGLPQKTTALTVPVNVAFADHLPSNELNDLVLQSAIVICRSGYSSIMDLVKLDKKALLVPTPGQTEQEYLARYLKDKKIFNTVSQDALDIAGALDPAAHFKSYEPLNLQEIFADVVERFVAGLKFNNTGT
jgi:uncharacterized protein (TIGR00661 family)